MSVTDCSTGKAVQHKSVTIDDEYNYLLFLPIECGNKYYDVNYLAGYDADTVPAPIVEAVTKLFEHKRQSFLEMQTPDKKTVKKGIPTAIPQDIKELLLPYQRKRL